MNRESCSATQCIESVHKVTLNSNLTMLNVVQLVLQGMVRYTMFAFQSSILWILVHHGLSPLTYRYGLRFTMGTSPLLQGWT